MHKMPRLTLKLIVLKENLCNFFFFFFLSKVSFVKKKKNQQVPLKLVLRGVTFVMSLAEIWRATRDTKLTQYFCTLQQAM